MEAPNHSTSGTMPMIAAMMKPTPTPSLLTTNSGMPAIDTLIRLPTSNIAAARRELRAETVLVAMDYPECKSGSIPSWLIPLQPRRGKLESDRARCVR